MSVIRNQKQLHYFSVFKEKVFFKKKTSHSAAQDRKNTFGCKELRAASIIYLFI